MALGAALAALAYANFAHHLHAGLSSYVATVLFAAALLDTVAFHVDEYMVLWDLVWNWQSGTLSACWLAFVFKSSAGI